MTIKIHTQFSGRVRVQTENSDKSKTHQSFKDEVDVNQIVKRHRSSGVPLPTKGLIYQDVYNLSDYRQALDNVKHIGEIFMSLPAASRAYFDHDPATFLDWTFENDADTVDSLVHGPPTQPEPAPAAEPAAAASAEPFPVTTPDTPASMTKDLRGPALHLEQDSRASRQAEGASGTLLYLV